MHVTQALSDGVRESLIENGSATSECPVQPIQFVDVFPRTLDARIDLFPDSLETQAPTGIYTYRGKRPPIRIRLYCCRPQRRSRLRRRLASCGRDRRLSRCLHRMPVRDTWLRTIRFACLMTLARFAVWSG